MMEFNKIVRYPGMLIYYSFLLIGGFLLLLYSKGEWVVLLNGYHTKVGDIFFKYWTFLGDGIIFVLLILFFLFRNYFFALLTVLSTLIQTIFIQGLKRYVFYDTVRPKLFFENFNSFHMVEGVEIHGFNAFPSGHTATAFAIAIILSLYIKNKRWSSVFIVGAILVGVSRVYLLQHFFIDIYFGSFIGILSVLIALIILAKRTFNLLHLQNKSLLPGG